MICSIFTFVFPCPSLSLDLSLVPSHISHVVFVFPVLWFKYMATFASAPMAKTASSPNTYLAQLVTAIKLLLNDKRYFWHLAILAILGDAVLTQLIIRFISCQLLLAYNPVNLLIKSLHSVTEIDYETYMEQVACYETGERSYTFLTGPSGPLVYVSDMAGTARHAHSLL